MACVLNADLPFHKTGIAHLACRLINPGGEVEEVLSLISDEAMRDLFTKAAQRGVGIEINADDWNFQTFSQGRIDQVIRVFAIAKECGCKFYLGSDAHHPNGLDGAIPIFENAVAELDLKESDKF